jgi:hypothetical protein
MNEDAIAQYIADTFDGVDVVVASRESGAPEVAWGDTFFFYNPDPTLPPNRRLPFATIVTKDYGEFDRASDLNRPGVFRLNIGVSKQTYRSLFGSQTSPSGAGDRAESGYDFAALDRVLPHPVYAPQSWVCLLNPSVATFQAVVRPLLDEAYDLAVSRNTRRMARE